MLKDSIPSAKKLSAIDPKIKELRAQKNKIYGEVKDIRKEEDVLNAEMEAIRKELE
jgi:predicted  nucleic acid-binding Zn-ribbon protein